LGIIPGKRTIIEETVAIPNVDPVICSKLHGAVDEHGRCLIRIRVDSSNPDRAELLKINYVSVETARSSEGQ